MLSTDATHLVDSWSCIGLLASEDSSHLQQQLSMQLSTDGINDVDVYVLRQKNETAKIPSTRHISYVLNAVTENQ